MNSSSIKASKISIVNNGDGSWTIWNRWTKEVVNIIAFQDSSYFGFKGNRYRVITRDGTIATLISHFATAKSIAIKHLRGGM